MISSANAIEACFQLWGTDDEVIRMHGQMNLCPIPALNVEQRNTAHTVVMDYADRTSRKMMFLLLKHQLIVFHSVIIMWDPPSGFQSHRRSADVAVSIGDA